MYPAMNPFRKGEARKLPPGGTPACISSSIRLWMSSSWSLSSTRSFSWSRGFCQQDKKYNAAALFSISLEKYETIRLQKKVIRQEDYSFLFYHHNEPKSNFLESTIIRILFGEMTIAQMLNDMLGTNGGLH